MMWKIILILIFSHNSSAKIDVKFQSNNELVDAVHVIVKILTNKHPAINFISAVADPKEGKFLDLKSELLFKCEPKYLVRLDIHTKVMNIPKRVKKNIIFLLDTVESFDVLKAQISPSKFDFNGNYLFVLVSSHTVDVVQIFNAMWLKNIYNVNVIYEAKNEIILTTFRPFESSKSCGDTRPKIINKFRAGKFENDLIFPPKMGNFNGCPLRVVTFEDEDVVMRTSSNDLHGYGAELLQVLAEKLNFKPHINFLTEDFAYGIVFDNGTAVGSLGELYHNRSDFAIGDFFLKPRRAELFDYTVPYQVLDLVWIIPPSRAFTPLEKLLQPFSDVVWILIAVILVTGIFVIFIINYRFESCKSFVFGRNVRHPLINMYIAMLGSQQTHLPMRNFARFLLMMFLLYCLVLRNIYQGALYQFLQSDGRHREIQTIDEMIEQDFTFYAFETSTLDLIQGSAEIFKRTRNFKKDNFFLTQNIDENAKIAGLETLKNVITSTRGNLTINYCKETFMHLNIVLYLRKNSYLTKTLNSQIDQFLSSGIIQHYIRKHHHDVHAQMFIKRNQKVLKKLNIWQLSGAFYLLLFGHIIALISFICELAVSHQLLRRLNYAKRYYTGN